MSEIYCHSDQKSAAVSSSGYVPDQADEALLAKVGSGSDLGSTPLSLNGVDPSAP